MKKIFHTVKDEEYTFLKEKIGFDNLEEFFRPYIRAKMGSDLNVNGKTR